MQDGTHFQGSGSTLLNITENLRSFTTGEKVEFPLL